MVVSVFVMLMMVVVMMAVVLLSHSLAAPALFVFFLQRVAERLSLLLVPCAQTLAAEHEIVVIDDDRLHPGMSTVLLVRHGDVGEVIVLRVIGRRVVRSCHGDHFEGRWTVVVL